MQAEMQRAADAEEAKENEHDPASADKTKAKKGKLIAKSTGFTYQFQIMESIGVPRAEIKKFADPQNWLTYFPPIAIVRPTSSRHANQTLTRHRPITTRSVRVSTGVVPSLRPTPTPTTMLLSAGRSTSSTNSEKSSSVNVIPFTVPRTVNHAWTMTGRTAKVSVHRNTPR